MDELKNPHDKFFRETFSHIELAKSFLRYYLPKEIAQVIDLDTLKFCKDTYIDPILKEQFADLLFSVQVKNGEDLRIYILLEHKSYLEPLIAYHMLKYSFHTWDQDIKEGRSFPFRPILPLVLYHGSKKWNISLEFSVLLPPIPELQAYFPQFRYLLLDLNQFQDEEIIGEPSLVSTLRLLKHIFKPDIRERLEGIITPLTQIDDLKKIGKILDTMVVYLMSGSQHVKNKELVEEIKEVFHKKGNIDMMTFTETIRNEGELKKAREDILDILEVRFGSTPERIKEYLSSIEDKETLRSLHKKAVVTPSLERYSQEFLHL